MPALVHSIETKITGRLQLVLDDDSYGANDEGKRVIELGTIEIPVRFQVSPDFGR